jgi:aconitase B
MISNTINTLLQRKYSRKKKSISLAEKILKASLVSLILSYGSSLTPKIIQLSSTSTTGMKRLNDLKELNMGKCTSSHQYSSRTPSLLC